MTDFLVLARSTITVFLVCLSSLVLCCSCYYRAGYNTREATDELLREQIPEVGYLDPHRIEGGYCQTTESDFTFRYILENCVYSWLIYCEILDQAKLPETCALSVDIKIIYTVTFREESIPLASLITMRPVKSRFDLTERYFLRVPAISGNPLVGSNRTSPGHRTLNGSHSQRIMSEKSQTGSSSTLSPPWGGDGDEVSCELLFLSASSAFCSDVDAEASLAAAAICGGSGGCRAGSSPPPTAGGAAGATHAGRLSNALAHLGFL
nr:hypothetical protein Iba_chr10aCG1360 [Ipomoea batatas]